MRIKKKIGRLSTQKKGTDKILRLIQIIRIYITNMRKV